MEYLSRLYTGKSNGVQRLAVEKGQDAQYIGHLETHEGKGCQNQGAYRGNRERMPDRLTLASRIQFHIGTI